MKSNTVRLAVLSLFTAVIIAAPSLSRAQDANTNAPAAADQTAPAKPARHSFVFRGKVGAVDTNAMTFTIGKRTFDITSETKITKEGKPAVLSDIAVGDKVGGAYKKSENGNLDATTVNDGKKTDSDMQQ
jgi:hypothetical protein